MLYWVIGIIIVCVGISAYLLSKPRKITLYVNRDMPPEYIQRSIDDAKKRGEVTVIYDE